MLLCQCFWSDRDGDTYVRHVADGGEIRIGRDPYNKKLWVCLRCSRSSESLKLVMSQADELPQKEERGKPNGGGNG